MSNNTFEFRNGVCLATFDGDPTVDVVVPALEALAAERQFSPGMPQILDLRHHTNIDGIDGLMEIARTAALIHAGAKRRLVAVVCGDAMFEKIVKLYREILRQRRDDTAVDIEFFLDLDDAWAWIAADRQGRAVSA